MNENLNIKAIIEAVLFASNTPVSIKALQKLFIDEGAIDKKTIKSYIEDLKEEYELAERSFELTEIADGYILQSRAEYFDYIQKLLPPKHIKLSASSLEVLAVIAYKQPITKVEVENIRGVDSAYALTQLLERELIINNKKLDAPGQPSLYETTNGFLEYFGLKNLKDLPDLPRDIVEKIKDEDLNKDPHNQNLESVSQ